jgi:hypothetical protein
MFHIHAPFSSTVARDSIKNINENEDLIDEISFLICDSLEYIKINNYLNFDFLRCLPIIDDNIPIFYNRIRKRLINIFNSKNYMELDTNLFEPANKCVHTNTSIKKFFDISIYNKLSENSELKKGWIKNPSQKNSREYKFIKSLDIKEYTKNDFLEDIIKNLDNDSYLFSYINKKDNIWLYDLYTYLYTHFDNKSFPKELKKLIRLENNNLNIEMKDCFFTNEGMPLNGNIAIVHNEVFKEGYQTELFLKKLGVQKFDIKKYNADKLLKEIEFILNTYYKPWDNIDFNVSENIKHLNLFTKYFKLTNDTSIFKNKSYFYKFLRNNNGEWSIAEDILIDEPWEKTNLGVIQKEKLLFEYYYINIEDKQVFLKFIKQLGASSKIIVDKKEISLTHPDIKIFNKKKGRASNYKIDEDYFIENLDKLLTKNSKELSLTLWNELSSLENYVFYARYRYKKSDNIIEMPSSLNYSLRENRWIPNKEGEFFTPKDISQDMLSNEFVFDNRNKWLDSIEFGTNIKKNNQIYKEKEKMINEACGHSFEDIEALKDISTEELRKFISYQRIKKESIKTKKTLKESLEKNQVSNESIEFVNARNEENVIYNEREHINNIKNEDVSNNNKFNSVLRKVKVQNENELNKIKDFLYKEYEGHCQICGDTFAYKGKNVYRIKSLNVGKDRDINRKGNTLLLCHKHQDIFDKNIQENVFLENFSKELSLEYIKSKYYFSVFVGRDDIQNRNDAFYRSNDDSFIRDVYFLPIKLFGKIEFIKFTDAHILELINEWNKS